MFDESALAEATTAILTGKGTLSLQWIYSQMISAYNVVTHSQQNGVNIRLPQGEEGLSTTIRAVSLNLL